MAQSPGGAQQGHTVRASLYCRPRRSPRERPPRRRDARAGQRLRLAQMDCLRLKKAAPPEKARQNLIRRVGRGNFSRPGPGTQNVYRARLAHPPGPVPGPGPGSGPQSGNLVPMQSCRTKSSSRSDSSPGGRGSGGRRRASGPAAPQRYRHHSSATESAPPEMAQMTRSPCSKSRCSRQNDRI